MRVVLLSLFPLDPQRISGGVRAVARYLVDGLRRYPDLELHVVHCHSDIAGDQHLTYEGVPVHYLALSRRRIVPNLLRSIPRTRRLLREIGPDVVSAHTAPLALASMGAGLPTLFTMHNSQWVEWWSWHALGDVLRYQLSWNLEKRALRRARHLVAISAFAEVAYSRYTRGRWHRIPNPLPDDLFAVPTDQEEAVPTLLYAGSIGPGKDLLSLVRALRRVRVTVPSIRLEIAGKVNNPAYHALVQAEIAALGLGDAVHYHGLLDREALLAAYARATLVVLASLAENSPMSVAEAMAAGKAVVATRVGGVPELVADGETGLLVPAREPEGLAHAIRSLLESPSRRQAMGLRARQVARERFSLAAVAASYRQALYETAGWPPPQEA